MTSEESHLIGNYLNGMLSLEETKEIEQRISEEKSFRESVLIEMQLFDSIDPERWSYVQKVNEENKNAYIELSKRENILKLKETIDKANATYQNSVSGSKNSLWKIYSTAAAVVIICGLVFLWPTTPTTDELYTNALNLSELPSLTYRGENDSERLLEVAQEAFENKNYKEALAYFQDFRPKDPSNTTLEVYKGIAYMELGNYAEAREIFETLANSDVIDAPKGEWYMALLFLKKGDKDTAGSELQKIAAIPSHYKYEEAKSLLKYLLD
ncbi:tetratricopeptide repeat protein [Dokdonia sp.]|uniref:tetratricopeptide repeat protein n=1 Tax=Dokdonia sp. TaxID=2024995 RepID=UPI0032652F07